MSMIQSKSQIGVLFGKWNGLILPALPPEMRIVM